MRKGERGWSHFAHAADVGIEGWGPTMEEAFEQAALALTAAVTSAPVEPSTEVQVRCEARDPETLLVDWLNAVIYEMAVRKTLFGRFQVRVSGLKLVGSLWGEAVDPQRHDPGSEPKGATYTALRVARDEEGIWSARCVVDV